MNISMYRASAPVLARALTNLVGVLEKGAAFAEQKKIDPSVLINYRLAPDMYPLSRQVQIASDMSKGCVARLAGREPPRYEDDETTFTELIARLRKTVEFINGFKPADIDGSEERNVTIQRRTGPQTFKGLQYLQEYVQPNVYFHVTTAYAILRHCGVEIGKADYLGNL
jgi:hypothetical protein